MNGPTPGTIIIVHPRERRSKCSVEPLRGRPDLEFHKFSDQLSIELTGYVRLGLGGPILSEADRDSGLLLLDGTWKLAARMEPFYSHVPVRSLPPLKTAFPRVSRLYADPNEGLATVEALYAAWTLLGRDTSGLLDHYHWADQFTESNRSVLAAGSA